MDSLHTKEKIKKYIENENLIDILPSACIDILELKEYQTDHLIVKAGASVDYLHLLLKGKARVSPASEEGKVGFLDFVLAKDVIGDLEYFSGDKYYYNVTALIPCIALAIPVKYIESFFNDNVEFYKFICKNMSTKMKRTSLKYSKTLLYPVKNQVANYIYELYQHNNKTTLPIMFKETAEFFDISPRYFRSVLVELENEGLLSRSTSGIDILDLDKLSKYKIK